MGGYDGYVRINTKLETREFQQGESAIVSGLGRIAKAVVAAFSVAAVVRFGKECVDLASDIAEVDNVVSKAFGSMRGEMDALANSAIKNLGMSRLTAYQTGSTFMSMGRSMLDSAEDAKTMALELTKLTGNMSSFYNKSQDLVALALKSVYTGETETLKQYGIVMTEANLKQFALAEGITKTYNEMTQSEKVMLRYQYVMKQTAFIGNDFIDTQDSWANQTRILKEQWKEFMTILGTGLITVLTPVVKGINSIISALITMANAIGSILSNVFGIQMQEFGAAESAADGVADSYGGAADAAKDYADAVDEGAAATKKAKKENDKATASFDTIKKLSTNKSSDSGSGGKGKGKAGGGSGGGALGSTIDTKAMETGTNKMDEAFKKWGKTLTDIITKLKQLATIAKINFEFTWEGLDIGGQIDELVGHITTIGDALKDIFTADEVQTAADGYITALAAAIGSITASITSIGLSIGNLITGGIADWLTKDKDRIIGYIVRMFEAKTEILEAVTSLCSSIAQLFQTLTNKHAQAILGNVLSIVGNIIGTVSTVVLEGVGEILDGLATIIEDNLPDIQEAIEAVQECVEDVTDVIAQAVEDLSDGILDIWDNHLKPFIDDVVKGVSDIVKSVLEAWNKNISPIIKQVGKDVKNLYDTYVKPIIDNVVEIIGDVIDIIKELWNNVLQPVVKWVSTKVIELVSPVLKTLWNIVGGKNGAVAMILDIVKSITDIVKNVVKAVKGIITGDWKLVWESAKNILKGIAQSIVNILFGMANKGIDALNGLLGGLREIVNMGAEVVNQLFGTSFKIPKISHIPVPQLAEGAVIPANSPFLAMLGDQKQGVNIETPLDTMVQAFKMALNEGGYSGGGKEATVIMQVDQTEFGRAIVKFGDKEKQRVGISLI